MPGSTSTLRLGLATVLLSLVACSNAPTRADIVDPYQPKPYVQLQTPEWARDAAIYQLNTRQFTTEGTFHAAERELPSEVRGGCRLVTRTVHGLTPGARARRRRARRRRVVRAP